MSPLRGIQNAGIGDPLPLQRKCVHTRCLFGLEQRWEGPRTPSFPAKSTNSTGLCLTITARSETSLAPRGSPDAQRGGEVCSWKGLGESPGCPPALFSFGVCLGFVRGWHPSTSRRSAAEGKRLSQFSPCRRHWETNMSPWQPQGYLTQQHSQKHFIFLNGQPASAMSAEPTGLLFVCF